MVLHDTLQCRTGVLIQNIGHWSSSFLTLGMGLLAFSSFFPIFPINCPFGSFFAIHVMSLEGGKLQFLLGNLEVLIFSKISTHRNFMLFFRHIVHRSVLTTSCLKRDFLFFLGIFTSFCPEKC